MEIITWAGLVAGIVLLILTWHCVIVTTIQPRIVTSYITFLGAGQRAFPGPRAAHAPL
jgi:hypothetical protein